jgi:hypothetical protein
VYRVEAEHGDPLAAFDHITLVIRNCYDSGNVAYIRFARATLAVFLDRPGRLEPAATIAGFAFSPIAATLPEFSAAIAHLREVLGEATYAYDQIDQARPKLEAVSK